MNYLEKEQGWLKELQAKKEKAELELAVINAAIWETEKAIKSFKKLDAMFEVPAKQIEDTDPIEENKLKYGQL